MSEQPVESPATEEPVTEPEPVPEPEPTPEPEPERPVIPEAAQEPEPPVPAKPRNIGGSRAALASLSAGQTFVWGHDAKMARALLDAAAALGLHKTAVRFNGAGFIVPDAVYDEAAPSLNEEF